MTAEAIVVIAIKMLCAGYGPTRHLFVDCFFVALIILHKEDSIMPPYTFSVNKI